MMGSPRACNWVPFSLGCGRTSTREYGLEGPLCVGEGEKVASSMSEGVSASDGVSSGEGGKREGLGSKFRNSFQSELKVGRTGCSRVSCGISKRAEKSSSRVKRSGRGAAKTLVQ